MNNENNLAQEDIELDQDILELEQSPYSNLGMNFDFYSPFRVDAKNTSEASWERFLQKINTLPVSVKDILTSEDTVEFIITLTEDFELADNQSADLSRIIRDVLMGDLSTNNLSLSISQELNLEQGMAKEIQDKIVNNLLAPIIEDLKKPNTYRPSGQINRPITSSNPQAQKIPERPDLKIDPSINKNNIVDLRNR